MGGDRHTLERKRKGLTGGGWGWVLWEGSVVWQCTASRVDAWHLKESPSDREAARSSLSGQCLGRWSMQTVPGQGLWSAQVRAAVRGEAVESEGSGLQE